jgi:hypothetical protein
LFLATWKRIGLKIHGAFCFVCSRYQKQVMTMQDFARGSAEHEQGGDCQFADVLSDEPKARMRATPVSSSQQMLEDDSTAA